MNFVYSHIQDQKKTFIFYIKIHSFIMLPSTLTITQGSRNKANEKLRLCFFKQLYRRIDLETTFPGPYTQKRTTWHWIGNRNVSLIQESMHKMITFCHNEKKNLSMLSSTLPNLASICLKHSIDFISVSP